MRHEKSFRAIIQTSLVLSLATLCFAQQVPKPEEVLGFKVGADYHLATYTQAIEYFKILEQSSKRIKLFEAGKTAMGQTMTYAVISTEANIADLEKYKGISKKLALVKGFSDEDARKLAEEGKAFVYIDGGLHATECAPAQHNIQLAYDLVTAEDQQTLEILDKVILILVFANPDGMNLVAEWYHQNLGTPYEISPMPWLYHVYIGHDNNRDSYMLNMPESRNIARIVNREWFPIILYNHHQTAPFPARIWIPPSAEPTNPNLHPLLLRAKNLIGAAMGLAFDQEGKPGAISRTHFDLWYPGYVDAFGEYFNVVSILTETALYRYATPRFYTIRDFPEEFKEFTISSFYPSPWKGGWWRLRDAVDYCLTASRAVLETAAKYPSEFLYNKYQMGRDDIARFEKEPPYAWIIPKAQWDAPTAADMLNRLLWQGISIYQADADFVSDGITYPAGTWIVPMNQPFASYVKTLFEEQRTRELAKHPSLWQGLVSPQIFPDAHIVIYDLDGWTLPYQMGVKVVAANTPLQVSLTPVKEAVPPAGSVASSAAYAYLIPPNANNSYKAANRILKNGGEVLRARESFTSAGKEYPPGTWIITTKSISASQMKSLADELHLEIGGAAKQVSATFKVKVPRIALYKPWTASMDEGWTRWLLEQFEFPFKNVHDADIKAGGLRARFDVLVLPSMSGQGILKGHKQGTMPPQYVGGIGEAGVRNIKQFIEEGGVLVTLNASGLFAIEQFRLPVRDALKGIRPSRRRYGDDEEAEKLKPPKFSCSGSILRMEFDTKHPVAYGMPKKAPGVFLRSPAFTTFEAFGSEKAPVVIAKYPNEPLLMSGYLKGEEFLQNKAAVVEVPLGKGKVILLGFGVQNRAQPHGTFKLLFNSLYTFSKK